MLGLASSSAITLAVLTSLAYGLLDFGRRCNRFGKEGEPDTCDTEKHLVCLFGTCRCAIGSKYLSEKDACVLQDKEEMREHITFGARHMRRLLGEMEKSGNSPLMRKLKMAGGIVHDVEIASKRSETEGRVLRKHYKKFGRKLGEVGSNENAKAEEGKPKARSSSMKHMPPEDKDDRRDSGAKDYDASSDGDRSDSTGFY